MKRDNIVALLFIFSVLVVLVAFILVAIDSGSTTGGDVLWGLLPPIFAK